MNNIFSIFKKDKMTVEERKIDFLKRQEESNPFNKFFQDTQAELEAAGITVQLISDKVSTYPDSDNLVNGYFDSDTKIFMCCIGKDMSEWMPIYIHEYCHFKQWEEKADVWENGSDLELEADCERRVVDMILLHNILIDVHDYAQKANAYVHFYNYIDLYDKWYISGKEPYKLTDVFSQFNNTIDEDFELSWEYMALYDKHCF